MKKPKKNRQGEGGEETRKELEAFSARLRNARNKSGLTQQEVATAIGLSSYNSYQYWERAQRWPSCEYLSALCLTLRVKADSLIGLISDQDENGEYGQRTELQKATSESTKS